MAILCDTLGKVELWCDTLGSLLGLAVGGVTFGFYTEPGNVSLASDYFMFHYHTEQLEKWNTASHNVLLSNWIT